MLLTVTTTHRPATDLGYLLVKHPDRVHSFDVPTGTAYVLYPEATEERCTAALLLDVDPQRLRRRRQQDCRSPWASTSTTARTPRPACSPARCRRCSAPPCAATRRTGRSWPPRRSRWRCGCPCCAARVRLAVRLFEPLGWTRGRDADPAGRRPADHPLAATAAYVDLTLTGTLRLADALNHLYVLLPVLDDAKHYWVAPDEIDKLLRAGEGWLGRAPGEGADHPALPGAPAVPGRRARWSGWTATTRTPWTSPADTTADEDAELPVARKQSLAEQRREAVLAALAEAGATRVLDLGCGGGALLGDLMRDRRFTEIVGTDVSSRALDLAARRLRLDRLPDRQRDRITLWQSALTYRDDRLRGYDAAVLMEVIEHLDPPRLPALEASVFGHARPATVVVTTPNVEYNVALRRA